MAEKSDYAPITKNLPVPDTLKAQPAGFETVLDIYREITDLLDLRQSLPSTGRLPPKEWEEHLFVGFVEGARYVREHLSKGDHVEKGEWLEPDLSQMKAMIEHLGWWQNSGLDIFEEGYANSYYCKAFKPKVYPTHSRINPVDDVMFVRRGSSERYAVADALREILRRDHGSPAMEAVNRLIGEPGAGPGA